MQSLIDPFRRAVVAYAALAALATASCGGSTEPEPEPEIQTVQITVGTSTVQFATPTAPQTPGPLTLRVNQANQMTVRFLGADGQDEPLIAADRDDFELRAVVPTGWTFTPTGGSGASFTANVTPTQTGSAAFTLLLFSVDHLHEEWKRDVSVSVTQ